jgi:hypothetical protein
MNQGTNAEWWGNLLGNVHFDDRERGGRNALIWTVEEYVMRLK